VICLLAVGADEWSVEIGDAFDFGEGLTCGPGEAFVFAAQLAEVVLHSRGVRQLGVVDGPPDFEGEIPAHAPVMKVGLHSVESLDGSVAAAGYQFDFRLLFESGFVGAVSSAERRRDLAHASLEAE